MNFTLDDKLKCVQRELKFRRRVYPRFIIAGKLTPQKAEHEIAVMEAIEADYTKQVEAGRLI